MHAHPRHLNKCARTRVASNEYEIARARRLGFVLPGGERDARSRTLSRRSGIVAGRQAWRGQSSVISLCARSLFRPGARVRCGVHRTRFPNKPDLHAQRSAKKVKERASRMPSVARKRARAWKLLPCADVEAGRSALSARKRSHYRFTERERACSPFYGPPWTSDQRQMRLSN